MESKNVSELAKQVRGVSYKPEDLHDGLNDKSVILLRANNINDGKINFDDVVYVDKSKVSKEQYLQNGDILICASSGSKQLVGKAASVDFDIECTFGAFCKVVRPNPSIAEFLGIYFQSNTYRQKVSEVAIGANINNIRNEHIDNLILSVGTDEENSEIVRMMKVIQRLIDERKQEVQELDKLVKARFIEVFGDPVLNSMKWEEHKLSEYILFMTSGSRGWSKYFTDDGSEVFITIKNVKNNKITLKEIQFVNAPDDKEAKRTKVQAGDLLISITADLGRTGIVSNEIAKQGAYINQHLSLIRLDVSKISPHFVSYYLETEAGKRQFASKNQSAVKAGLSFESIKSLKILVPPMELQRDYVLFIEQAYKSKLQVYQNIVINHRVA